MRLLVLFSAAALCSCFAIAELKHQSKDNSQTPPAAQSRSQPATTSPARFPVQLEMRVPFEPTAFPSAGHTYLMYELHLTNFGTALLTVSRIEVLDAVAAAQPIAIFEAEQLETMLQPVGANRSADPKKSLEIAGGGRAVVFMSIALDRNSRVPDRLLHRVTTTDAAAEGAVIGTHHTTLRVLGPPVEGADWLAADGPSNDEENHHRRGLVIFDGRAVISRRYAIDWKQIKNGASFSGDSRDTRSYYAYEKAVLAVADGRVVAARDGLPDNVPGHGESFHPAVPITLETVAGNTITLDLGGGQFAYYMHLEPGSLRAKTGERVRRGQVLARIGCSGDAREPHLHFEVTTSSKLVAGEGVPYLIDRYRSTSTSGGPLELRIRELPLNNSVVVFEEDGRK